MNIMLKETSEWVNHFSNNQYDFQLPKSTSIKRRKENKNPNKRKQEQIILYI